VTRCTQGWPRPVSQFCRYNLCWCAGVLYAHKARSANRVQQWSPRCLLRRGNEGWAGTRFALTVGRSSPAKGLGADEREDEPKSILRLLKDLLACTC